MARASGNISLDPERTGLPRPSVADVSAIITIDKASRDERVASLDRGALDRVLAGRLDALSRERHRSVNL